MDGSGQSPHIPLGQGGSGAYRVSQIYDCVPAVNNSDSQREVKIPAWEIGINDRDTLTRVMVTNTEGYNAGFVVYPVENGTVTLTMEAYSGILLISNKKP